MMCTPNCPAASNACEPHGKSGFQQGGGSIEPRKTGGRVWEKGSIDRAINQEL